MQGIVVFHAKLVMVCQRKLASIVKFLLQNGVRQDSIVLKLVLSDFFNQVQALDQTFVSLGKYTVFLRG